jgi:hypothetical protein
VESRGKCVWVRGCGRGWRRVREGCKGRAVVCLMGMERYKQGGCLRIPRVACPLPLPAKKAYTRKTVTSTTNTSSHPTQARDIHTQHHHTHIAQDIHPASPHAHTPHVRHMHEPRARGSWPSPLDGTCAGHSSQGKRTQSPQSSRARQRQSGCSPASSLGRQSPCSANSHNQNHGPSTQPTAHVAKCQPAAMLTHKNPYGRTCKLSCEWGGG